MPFTIFGPGVQDSMSSRQLFPNRVVEEPADIAPYPRIPGSDEEPIPRGRPGPQGRQRLAQQAREAYAETEESGHERHRVHQAREVMSAPVVTLQADASIWEAWQLFRDHRFRHIPVLAADGGLIGIVSDRDLLRNATSLNGDHSGRQTIEDFVTKRVLTATPGTDIREIARVMHDQHIGALPIVTAEGELVGMITRGDILKLVMNNAPFELWA